MLTEKSQTNTNSTGCYLSVECNEDPTNFIETENKMAAAEARGRGKGQCRSKGTNVQL